MPVQTPLHLPLAKTVEARLAVYEELINARTVIVKRDGDGGDRMEFPAPRSTADMIEAGELREHWIQRYVAEHFRRFKFTAIKGPFSTGPDFHVRYRGKWVHAEVERSWREYLSHGHDKQESFTAVQYLIVLAADAPPDHARARLPNSIVHIDRTHFTEWCSAARAAYAKAHQPNSKLNAKVVAVANAMQGHWLEECPDKARDMACCPDCEFCAYFESNGAGARNFFFELAADFLLSRVRPQAGHPGMFDLRRVKEDDLRSFVDQYGPR